MVRWLYRKGRIGEFTGRKTRPMKGRLGCALQGSFLEGRKTRLSGNGEFAETLELQVQKE